MVGYITRSSGFMSWYLAGESSDWSPIQTVTIPASNPNPSPTVSEFPIAATLITVLVVVSLLLVIGKRKQSFNH